MLQKPTMISRFNVRGSGYELKRRFAEFDEITQSKGYYAVQGHLVWYQSKAHIRLPISD